MYQMQMEGRTERHTDRQMEPVNSVQDVKPEPFCCIALCICLFVLLLFFN